MQQDALPVPFKGDPLLVVNLSHEDRRRMGLSHPASVIQITSNEGLKEVFEYAKSKGRIGFDCETDGEDEDGLDPWKSTLVLLQVGDASRQYIIWARYITDWSPLHEMLADNNIVKFGQNIKFDLKKILVDQGIDKRAWNVADAGIVEQVLGCGLFTEADDKVGMTLKLTSMGAMARRWLGWEMPKDEELRTGWSKFTPDTLPIEKLLYAADDVIIPEMLLKRQSGWIKRFGLVETVNLEHSLIPVLADMEVRGMLMDLTKWDALSKVAWEKAVTAKKSLDKLFGLEIVIEIDDENKPTLTRDHTYGSKDQLKDMIRDYMFEHHNVTVVACNKHFKESLIANGFNPERVEKLFPHTMVPNPKKPGSRMNVGAPYMNDHCEVLWEEYKDYLPKNTLYLGATDSKVLRLNKIIHATEKNLKDDALPNKVGLPAVLVDPLLDMRKYTKAYGTYGPNWHKLINPITGRVHFEYIQAALTTGRCSSNPNCQNLISGPAYRAAFIARYGCKIVGSDFDQVEPRIIAELTNCFTYKRVFFSKCPDRPEFQVYCKDVTEALDLYTEVGKIMGVIPEWMTVEHTKGGNGVEPTKEGKKGRKQSKIVVLGLGYGTGKDKFFLSLIVDLGECVLRSESDALHEKFWDAVPEIKQGFDAMSALAYPGPDVYKWGKRIHTKSPRRLWHPLAGEEVTWSETLGGRKRFYKSTTLGWWTCGRNHPIQGLGADMLKRTMVLYARWCWLNLEPEYGLTNNVHDELLAEVPDDKAEISLQVMEQIMQEVGNSYCKSVPITAAGYIADFWVKE